MSQLQQVKKNDTFLYIGEDDRYWMSIQDRMKAVSKGKTFEYVKLRIDDFKGICVLVLKILAISPKVIFLDFTVNPAFMIKVGQVIRRTNGIKNIIVMGLFEQAIDDYLRNEVYSSGIYISHYKGIELYDVAFDSLVMMYPKESIRCEFATVNRKQDVEVKELVRVGYIAKDYLYVEGNAYLEDNEFITVDTSIFDKFIFSKSYQVKFKGHDNLMFDFENFYHLAYGYVEPLPPIAEGESPEVYKEKEKARLEEIEEIKGRQIDWININSGKINPPTKLLVIDKEFSLLHALEHTHKLKSLLSVRTQMCAEQDIELDVTHFLPHIIVFYFDRPLNLDAEFIEKEKLKKEDIDELVKTYDGLIKNDDTAFGILIAAVKRVPNYQPVILVSSSDTKHSSEELQKYYNYARIIHSKIGITIDQLTKMEASYRKLCEAEEEKNLKLKLEQVKASDPKKFRTLKIDQLRDKRVYLDTKDVKSVAYLSHRVTILTLSESEMIIESLRQLKLHTVYNVSTPVYISFTPIMEKKGPTSYGYRCLFHSYDEREKTSLRQLLNDLVLENKRKERAQEAENFKKMNQDAKQAKEQKAQDANNNTDKNNKN